MTGAALPPSVETAAIDWQDGLPVCKRFGDVYFNRDNGMEETRHVFIKQNDLYNRFASVGAGEHFVIAETGFGTGLNFLATWKLWNETNPVSGRCLHYISVERFPLTRSDLSKALALWPELDEFAAELMQQYPPPTHGAHRLVLAGGSVRLTLFFGDVLAALDALEFTADAWFLDGFAPSCNPDMWQEKLSKEVARHSQAGTTLATFTAAGFFRRQSAQSGFEMVKVPGFGRKRDMLTGTFCGESVDSTQRSPVPESVTIVGAGIAGSMLAANLAGRGIRVTVVDKADSAARGASGNSQGALYVKLGVDFSDQTQLALSSLLFAQRFYSQYEHCGWHPTGLIQLAHSDAEADRQRRFLEKNQYPESVLQPVDPTAATALSGLDVPYSGLWFPASGWLKPASVCDQLLKHPGIKTKFGFEVDSIKPIEGGWQLNSMNNEFLSSEQVILCGGADTPALIPLDGQFRIKAIRGQITEVAEESIQNPSLVLCGPGYVNPADGGSALIGATFDLHSQSSEVSDSSDQENLQMLRDFLPAAFNNSADVTPGEAIKGRVAFRCTTHDYQPIAGRLKTADGAPLEGLYLCTGLGSKGLTYSALMAEYLADIITSQPLCLPRNLIRRVDSQRCHRPKVT
ncbi:bifunctional tRNA (5-methylaminomethyl-2-thiouridine)(34)-methyltransferase MnmD/FAD-dependent 5-carboxymethylaminomethyl-2-thiouridine(34) oxidoreductase MnmC [Marinobacter sp. CHS3-4]|uniref:bifunctional tRNA (5-methylaminomethyl-2-thiouridine)(34)-methyltransferase MnmD/FAD-dependent 5-carboxymethylaminomethyl-2-thiouridine(34) oxidoreductase MnmC n=1 Tax=Marinobacter sp. CHS3-4 TaxID=3045174 RepID=UPI0024B61BC1|nr:bifunctional tRNA (5-methylaminomethyl-2-thiouridine)(34)-methyltransferase MnmD/FAD-dependent 5-carboxymethylaminomethyl-2-thiouridine(34) oxidoreductase MnmC [Marinobacter sp. CHS3-4]MDI9245267.1 bifunctional tRNA (5-methylaminomethyl-2-thiouridine)(34)-methyltransferase MnmD/FAD-dependent 5-carboxymethylaminomethyl-2-thiouridine(34) oxidoreductase MnmC [Marinobacter sp. CHS3-4]